MNEDIVIKNLPAQTALAVHARVTMATVAEKMGEAFATLMAHVGKTAARPAGPPFVQYPEMPSADFPIVVCLPVAAGAAGGGGVTLESLPAGEAATLLHKGPYAGMEPSWRRLLQWLQTSGRKPSGPMREVYLNDPRTCAPQDLLTELVVPLA